ncbi:MAG: DUF4105 domain-containing protein [Marinobacter sp.]|nr:DUF4105 domain-containing protein [Marinobacter sp.]
MGKLLYFGPAILWFFAGLPIQAYAQTATNSLHLNPAWLTLVHYQPDVFGSGFTSQADDPTFFLSEHGKTSPKAELNATLEAIQQPGEGNQHARCRFPARDAWLREQLNLPKKQIRCPDYEAWTGTLNTQSITLVFAASYLNSPSSMFGHTFLRLDPPQQDEKTSLLLANTISYAANAPDQDNELLFIYQGVFGGYPGTTTVQPYYEKIRLYSDIEHRDLWEYKLNLTKQEVDSMLAHAWEIQGRNFDYFFFDENCAYRLLALIDAARPGTELLEQVTTHAIPSDTVRWAVDKDLIASVHYRPSAATSVAYSLSNLPGGHQKLAAALANGDIAPNNEKVQSLNPKKKAKLLDATYDYVRYRSEADDWPTNIAAPLSHALLLERSKIDGVAPPILPPEPPVRDDQGHDTLRVSLSAGQLAHREFTQLTFRPAYHDVLDPPAGYRSGAQLQFFRLDARLYHDNDELQLEQLTGLEIRSLSPRNAFFSPLSWQVGFGGRRTDTGSKRVLTPYLEGGAGGSWSLGQGTQAFAIATADLEIDDDLRRGYDAAPGADIGLLHQSDYFSFSGGVKTKAWIVSGQHRQDQLYAKANWHIGREFSLFAEFTREDHYDRYQSTWQAGLHTYF